MSSPPPFSDDEGQLPSPRLPVIEDSNANDRAEEQAEDGNADAPPGTAAVPNTPAVPKRYPNLETATQMARAITKPRRLRRLASNQEDCLHVLTKVFKKPSFRGRQKEIMEAAINGADVLVVAPTGMGKSLCFQVPAVADSHGITVVISPLLSLMKNQVDALRGYGIKVHVLCSETSWEEKQEINRDLASGHPLARLLYITPESLFATQFLKALKLVVQQNEMRRLVVDEAHCISEWGSSFRPEYRKLGFFRKNFPHVPIMALTASATANVEQDIIEQLGLSHQHLYRSVEPFNRTNLYYEVRYRPEPDPYRIKDVETFIKSMCRHAPVDPTDPTKRTMVSGIIYCRARAMCDTIAELLRSEGIKAKPFHRGLKAHELDKTLKQWLEGSVECVVATIAFGMGIDKQDVRYVIHFDLPKSFEGYYQETGRAGRDGHISRCILYYSREDAVRLRRLVDMEKGKKAKQHGGSDEEEADIHSGVDSFKYVQHYAESTSLCRHVAICRYFGEVIDETNPEVTQIYCSKMCDICLNQQKVMSRSRELTEEVAIASQIPLRKKRDRQEFEPVSAVTFYDRPASPPAGPHGLAPRPRPAVRPPVTNPYFTGAPAAAPGPSDLGFGRTNAGIRDRTNAINLGQTRGAASNGEEPWKPKPAIILERSPPQKKAKIIQPSPYLASSQSPFAPNYTVAGRRLGSQHAFKTPFMAAPRAIPPPKTKSTRKLDASSSIELSFDDDDIQIGLHQSQKIPQQLRKEALKSIVSAVCKSMSNGVWERVFGFDMSENARVKAITRGCRDQECDLLAWSVTPEGYNDRVQSLLGIIKAKTSWQHLCSRRNEADDEADDDLRQLRSLERSINMACNGPAR